jgi:F-type H+-transporting ATPase subunit epsilon
MAERFVTCQVVTPFGKVFEGNAKMVVAKAVDGEIGILPLHIPLITQLPIGELRFIYKDNEDSFAVGGGYLRVAEDRVAVIVQSAEKAANIDVPRAEAAKRKAEEELAKLDKKDDIIFTRLQKNIERAVNRLRVAGKTTKS